MMRYHKCIILHLILCMGSISEGNKVLFLVVEGLTESLIGRIATPAIDALIAKGAIAGLKPEFPAETLPTLHSMMTGQHTEVTGILDMEVRGSSADQVLRFNEDAEFWNYSNNLTTVWNLNNRIEGHKTGSILWPGADYPINGLANNLRWGVPYDIVLDVSELNNTTTKAERSKRDADEESDEDSSSSEETDLLEVENVHVADTNSSFTEYVFNKTTDQEWIMWNSQIKATVSWLSQKADPVNLVLFNVNQPGQQIRTFGPESDEADFAVQKVDQMIANLVEQMQKKNIFDNVNIIITGCHGFTEVSTDKVFDISGLADIKGFIGHSPVININEGKKELDTYAKLQTGDLEKYDLYTKNLMPDRYHYKNNDRVDDIVLVAKEGFVFASDFWAEAKKLNKEQNRPSNLNNKYGKAGYDNALDSMQSLIILHGPGVQTHPGPEHLKPTIDAVDVFPLLSHLLELPPVASNGSLHAVRNLLRNPPSQSIEVIKKMVNYYTTEDNLPRTVSILVISTLVLILLICCGACAIRRRKNIGKNHNYRYSQVKSNRRVEGRVDGSESTDDKVGLLTSSIMEEDFEEPI
eukprot:TRINITY_DN8762_c0_g1_i2.p1 TRINITY_DN8762_c0_g1~~TRINITY_DN8762_c0_g1_i2.p1  ORF type:complete len:580 (+),score=132.33 TRINITY_DN8762_c0_g1_i2:291-2030(+)